MRVWIDVDNPPQVQYLLPFAAAFRGTGATVFITARDYGITRQLLGDMNVEAQIVGGEFGKSKVAKLSGSVARSERLARVLDRRGGADLVVSSSRSAALTARRRGIPCFLLCDYEHAELGIFRRLGTRILHPDVIPQSVFERKGFAAERLVPFPGLKEDLTFADVDIDAVDGHDFDTPLRKVLFRPPAEASHYFDPRSRTLSLEVLGHLAQRDDSIVVFSYRHPSQVADLERFSWRHDPIVLHRPLPFLSLLKGVDLVVSAGGTMLREAAYLGIPACSTFCSRRGAVDEQLAREGRLVLAASLDDFIEFDRASPTSQPSRRAPSLPGDLATEMLDTVRD